MEQKEEQSKGRLERISELLREKDYSNPELAGAKIFALCVLLVIALALFIFAVRIDSIEVSGDVSVFNESEVVEASGLSVGGCMYLKPSFAIKRSIRKNLPMAGKIHIFKNYLTRKVTVKVEFSGYEYFTEYGGKFYGLNKDLVVTDVRESRLEFISLGARYLSLPDIEEPRVGESVVFSATLDVKDEDGYIIEKGKDADKFDYASEFLSFLYENGYTERVNAVFLSEKYNIRLIIDGKYYVYVGKCDGLKTKFEVMDAIITEGSVNYGTYAVIDVQNPALASARVDNTLDIGDYVIESESENSGEEESQSEEVEAET